MTQVTADEIRAWRGRLGFSQAQAAAALDVPIKTLQGWEIGRPPSLPGLLRLAMRDVEWDGGGVPVETSPSAAAPTAAAAPAPAPRHNIPQTLARQVVAPNFRTAGKGKR